MKNQNGNLFGWIIAAILFAAIWIVGLITSALLIYYAVTGNKPAFFEYKKQQRQVCVEKKKWKTF